MKESELKPIDILANDINQHCPDLKENYCGDMHCVACLANALYEQGYRKQSEWISVEDRLPEENVRVLVSLNHFPEMDTDRIYNGRWVRWSDVTHWMPLPEAPTMKGGAE